MKKNIFLGVLALIIVAVVFVGVFSNEQKSDGTFKIGVIASMTGTGATRGESVIQGIELAKKEVSEKLGIENIEIVVQDVPLDQAKNAPAALKHLVEIENVDAIIGPMGSNVVLSVVPIVDDHGVPIIVHAASALDVTKDNEYVFRLWPIAQNYSDAISGEVSRLGYKRIAVLTATSDNTIDLLNFLKQEDGFEIAIEEESVVENKDFRTQLLKIKSAENVDAVFLNLFEGQTGIAAKQARELGITAPLFSNSVFSQVEVDAGGESTEGIWYPVFSGYKAETKEKFIAMFGKEPSAPDTATAAHDAFIALATAFSVVGSDSAKIKDYLYEKKFQGSIGEFHFMESGDAAVPLILKEVKNGEIVER